MRFQLNQISVYLHLMMDSPLLLLPRDAVCPQILAPLRNAPRSQDDVSLLFRSDPAEGGKAVKQGHYSVCEMRLRYELIAVAIVAIVDVTVMTASSVTMKLGFMTVMRHEDPSGPLSI